MASRAGRRIYSSKRWQILRREIFRRDGHRCVLCGASGRLECDHIDPVVSSVLWFEPTNLRTLCRTCHIKVTAEEKRTNRLAGNSTDARKRMRELADAATQ